MVYEVLMPKLSSTMTEGTLTMWLKEEGAAVEIGEVLFKVMTDKIAIEVESYEEGYLLKRFIKDGESAPVNSIIAYIGEKGETVPTKDPSQNSKEEPTPSDSTKQKKVEKCISNNTSKIRATPSARRKAREKSILLEDIKGAGPNGRIQAYDVEHHQATPPLKAVQNPLNKEKDTLIPWRGMRQSIAEKMVTSITTIPHVTMNAEVNMTKIVTLREQLLTMMEERLSYLEIIAKASMVALKSFPIFNAHALTEGIQRYQNVNLGIAVALPEGLVVPVISQADTMGLKELTHAVKTLTSKARDNQLTSSEMRGGTFTISSLGRSKVNSFNPIINTPEVAILGIGGMYDQLILDSESSQILPQKHLNLSLSFDHRVTDGAPAAEFLSLIVTLLENPFGLLL